MATIETKAQRAERLKREKNPWEGLEEIRRFAREGLASIPPEWMGTYFRWWGVYTQGDGAGVVGGQGGEGRALPYFMVRIRIPNGLLLSHQLRTIADLTQRYARGIADITVRQNIQLHWVTIEALPQVMEALWRCGLSTLGACGDVTRNITGCPVAGVDGDEVCDASPLTLEANRMLVGNSDFYNLPRKFKISITGCRVWCAYPEINDIGLTAIRRAVAGRSELGFSLRVGGGLSAMVVGVINAGELGFVRSFDFIIMVVLGGLGSISGAALFTTLTSASPVCRTKAMASVPWARARGSTPRKSARPRANPARKSCVRRVSMGPYLVQSREQYRATRPQRDSFAVCPAGSLGIAWWSCGGRWDLMRRRSGSSVTI